MGIITMEMGAMEMGAMEMGMIERNTSRRQFMGMLGVAVAALAIPATLVRKAAAKEPWKRLKNISYARSYRESDQFKILYTGHEWGEPRLDSNNNLYSHFQAHVVFYWNGSYDLCVAGNMALTTLIQILDRVRQHWHLSEIQIILSEIPEEKNVYMVSAHAISRLWSEIPGYFGVLKIGSLAESGAHFEWGTK